MFNGDTKTKFKEANAKKDEVAKSLGVKVTSAISPIYEHRIFFIVEAPNQQAVEKYFLETGFLFWNAVETLTEVHQVEDVITKILK
jgi:uncharacterized protein with GYD domain